jgi:Zn-dependent peptidase ImmA (M78 family)
MRRVLQAWKAAERVLADHGIRAAPVDVLKIAKRYATVIERSLDSDVSGALIPLIGGKWAIVVNADHAMVRKRFTVAHELGHLLLHGYTSPHADRTFKFRDARSAEGTAIDEIQANQFAAELLMPRALVLKAAASVPFDHAPATEEEEHKADQCLRSLSDQFKVSRQAMTVRLSSLLS